MSGTSADSIDVVLVNLGLAQPEILATHQLAVPTTLRQQIIALSTTQNDSLHEALVLDRQIAIAFAETINELLAKAAIDKFEVVAIGSHGQTLRHQTFAAPTSAQRFTYQIGDPNTIAELTGIDVVADFRRRDIAAGGEAAPLAPGFHHHFFSHPQIVRAVVNIGGFSNASLLVPDEAPLGFDTGPGNCLLDGWIDRHLKLPFDLDGSWAAGGKVNGELLSRLKSHPFFQRRIPKSTGRELFNLSWLDASLEDKNMEPVDVHSTLMQLTVETLLEGLQLARKPIEEIYICGGGAKNAELMTRLENASGLKVQTTAALGIDPLLVECCAFAWMAQRTLQRLPANLPSVTGAKGARILGGIFHA